MVNRYFDALDELLRDLGMKNDHSDGVLVYAESKTMVGIQELEDLEKQGHLAWAGFVPLALINTSLTATKPGKQTRVIRILLIPPSCPDVESLRKRMALAVFSISPSVTECVHVDYRLNRLWTAPNPNHGRGENETVTPSLCTGFELRGEN